MHTHIYNLCPHTCTYEKYSHSDVHVCTHRHMCDAFLRKGNFQGSIIVKLYCSLQGKTKSFE